jgi:hypothetical protein
MFFTPSRPLCHLPWDRETVTEEHGMPSSTDRPEWRRASSCSGGNCIEVAKDGDRVLIRNSRSAGSAGLSFSADEWNAFIEGVKKDEFRFE